MSKPLTDQLRAYFDDVDGQQGAVDIDALRRSVEERVFMIELSPDKAVPPNAPSSGRRWPILIAAAAIVLVVGAIVVVATRDDDATPADQPSPTVTVPPTVPPQALSEWVAPPLGPPIQCEPQLCPWPSELTAHTLEPPIDCFNSKYFCQVAASPDGTLVAIDQAASTLIWYEEEPRVVPLPYEPPTDAWLIAIGPYDIAYLWLASDFVAVAPSGEEITRMTWSSNRPAYPTAAGLVPMAIGWPGSLSTLPTIPWVDLDGNPIIDTRPYPTATATDAGIEVRFGEREWLVTDRWGPLDFLAFQPRSDGGVVMIQQSPEQGYLLELSPDGTIDGYVVEPGAVLPDGSVIIEHHQLVRLTPPAA